MERDAVNTQHTGHFFVATTDSFIMDVVEVACVVAVLLKNRKEKRRRKYWVHPVISHRLLKGQFYTLYEGLRAYPEKFSNYFRMTCGSFDELLTILGPALSRQNTNMRKCVPAEERLAVTLR